MRLGVCQLASILEAEDASGLEGWASVPTLPSSCCWQLRRSNCAKAAVDLHSAACLPLPPWATQQDPFKRFMLYGSLADATALSPALAAALLADGLVEVLLADLTGEASVGDHRIPEPQASWAVRCMHGVCGL